MAESPVVPGTDPQTEILAEFSEYLDVPMQVSLEVGRQRLKVRDILLLKPESIIEVPKAAGENIDVYFNGRLAAFGEILEMEGKAGVRLTDFIAQS